MGRPEVRTTSPLPRVSRGSGAGARPPQEGRAETHHLPRAQAFRTALVRRAAIVSASERDAHLGVEPTAILGDGTGALTAALDRGAIDFATVVDRLGVDDGDSLTAQAARLNLATFDAVIDLSVDGSASAALERGNESHVVLGTLDASDPL